MDASPAPASASAAASGMVRADTPPEVDIVKARASGNTQAFEWHAYDKASFELAARDKKLILLDGAAAWCHWCHVMDETTYRDPEVGKILNDGFVAIRVDIDEHPDMAERYGDWGWPATILLSSDGKELGKFRGYLPKEELLEALRAAASPSAGMAEAQKSPAADHAATPAELPWAVAYALNNLDDFYDEDAGSWGRRQKAPIGDALELEARRALRGDERAKKRVLQTVAAQRALLDPVWGGVYQYSTGGGWDAPHYEKLMAYQAANLTAYALAYKATRDPGALKDAEAVASYMETLLSSEKGGFYVSQDADVGSHDPKSAFIDGDVYYRKSDAERRKLGMPHVDDHVYAQENGLAIAAFVAYHEATGKPAALARARRAADLLLSTHVNAAGRVVHDPEVKRSVLHLGDATSLGFALASLARVTGLASYREAAVRIAQAVEKDFASNDGALFGSTPDDSAVGVFAERRKPFDANLLAVRFYAELSKVTGEDRWKTRALAILSSLSTPRAIGGQGRMIGSYLLAADDAGVLQGVISAK